MIGTKFKPATVSRMRTILRFEEQNLNWNLGEFTTQTNAFAYGLKEARIAPDAKALVWLDEKHTAELATVLIGCLKAGVKTVSLVSKDGAKNVADSIAAENPDLLILSPNQKTSSGKKMDLLYEAYPQLQRASSYKKLGVDGLPNLRHVLHTGYYAKPGAIKFKDFLVYRDRDLSSHAALDYRSNYEAELKDSTALDALKPEDQVYYAGDLQNFTALKQAMLGSTLSGYFLHVLSPQYLKSSDLKFLNDTPSDVKCHVIVDKSTEAGLKERVTREAVNYIRL